MTPEELDEARAREAWEACVPRDFVAWPSLPEGDLYRRIILGAAALSREGWTPTDPDLIEAREIVAKHWADAGLTNDAAAIRAGEEDKAGEITIALAALRRGKELAGGGE